MNMCNTGSLKKLSPFPFLFHPSSTFAMSLKQAGTSSTCVVSGVLYAPPLFYQELGVKCNNYKMLFWNNKGIKTKRKIKARRHEDGGMLRN